MSSVKNMRDIYLLPREAMMEPPFAIPCSLKYVIALGKPQKTLFFSGQATKEGGGEGRATKKKRLFGEIVVLTKSVFGCLRLKKEKEKKKSSNGH